jgi:hypothetical protein
MHKLLNRMVVVIAGVVAVDLLIPTPGLDELTLQAVILAIYGGVYYLRQ